MENETDMKKILVFSIGNEFYGIYIDYVHEIIRYDTMTPLHDELKALKGVINLRGKIIPVVDFRLKLGLDFRDYHDKTVLVILGISGTEGDYNIALAVDAVQEVVLPAEGEMEQIPEIGLNLKRKFLSGIFKQGKRMIMILNIAEVIETREAEIAEKGIAE